MVEEEVDPARRGIRVKNMLEHAHPSRSMPYRVELTNIGMLARSLRTMSLQRVQWSLGGISELPKGVNRTGFLPNHSQCFGSKLIVWTIWRSDFRACSVFVHPRHDDERMTEKIGPSGITYLDLNTRRPNPGKFHLRVSCFAMWTTYTKSITSFDIPRGRMNGTCIRSGLLYMGRL